MIQFSEHVEEHLSESGVTHDDHGSYTPFSGEINIENSPIKGDLDQATLIIVEFSDFECPFCAEANDVVNSVLAENTDVVFVHKDYPLPYHTFALDAAVAARCAGEQDKYWEMYDLLYDNQSDLSSDALKSNAKTLRLDEKVFTTCLENSAMQTQVDADFEEGMNMKIDGTPAFVVGKINAVGESVTIDGNIVSMNELVDAVELAKQ